MKDLLAPEHVEGRLRRTLAQRAEDMAAGDGGDWDPADTLLPLGQRMAREHRLPARPLVAVAAVVVVVGGVAVGLGVTSRDEPPGTADATTAGNAASPTSAASPTPVAPTVAPTAPPTSSPDQIVGTPVGSYVRAGDGAVVRLEWYPPAALAWPDRPGSEDLQAGGYPANYWEEPDQETSSLTLFFDDGVLYLDGDETGMREDLLAFADGVRRVPGTTEFEVTPPPGFTPG